LAVEPQALERVGVDFEEIDRIGGLAGEQTHAVLRQFLAH